MRPTGVWRRVQDIRTMYETTGDYERAHSQEDELWEDVLNQIANGVSSAEARDLAFEALRTRSIGFQRVCG